MAEISDLIVIGGGSAGLVAAGGAAILGARVALIERNLLGGDCLYTGCVPSKTLIKSARYAHLMRQAETFGFQKSEPRFINDSFASITNRVQRVIKQIEPHDSPEVFEAMGVEVIFGSPKFLNPHEIEVALKDNPDEKRILRAKRFCIATGSRPAVAPIEGLVETGFITNEEVFNLQQLPGRLVILGGGAIGVELGQAFARLGSKVTIVEAADRILPKEDPKISVALADILHAEGVVLRPQTRAVRVLRSPQNNVTVALDAAGQTEEIECDQILCATGRKANTDGLDLEKAGVAYDTHQIVTDRYLRTTQKHIFAAGDVTGHFQFTHMADHEAQIVIQNAFVPWPFKKAVDFRVVPWATFTDPEAARVGMTESEAREKFGDGVKVYESEFADNDRAQTGDQTAGFVKVVTHRGRIVGAHLLGPHAGELIHEFCWAMHGNMKIDDLNKIIRVYPTLAKITQAAGTEATLETLRSPLVQKWFKRYLRVWR